MPGRRCFFAALVFFFTATGSFYPIFARGIMSNSYPWRYGLELQFKKPWFQTLLYFCGSAALSAVYFVVKRYRKVGTGKNTDAQLYRLSGIVSVLVVLASAIDLFTLMYIPTTVWQAFHGWQVVFSSVFAMTYQRQRLRFAEWIGLFLIISGISSCGVFSLLRAIKKKSDEISEMFFSYILVIIGSAIKAVATGIEEMLMQSQGINPLQLAAFEGIWGIIITGFIALPILNVVKPTNPLFESTVDIIEYFENSKLLILAEIGFLILVAMHAYLSLLVVYTKSAVDRFVYESIRPLAILVLSGMAYYVSNRASGDELDKYVIGEIAGVFILFLGTLVCMKVIKCCCLSYASETERHISELPDSYLLG